MKKITRVAAGVTLLEIMLVLAVAAMIIVMSVRYYQSANASQQATVVLQQITAITAAADSLSQGTGSYAGVTAANITPLLAGSSGLNTPWGTTITFSGSTSTYNVGIPGTPAAVCPLIWARLNGNTHFSSLSSCNATGPATLSYTYIQNP